MPQAEPKRLTKLEQPDKKFVVSSSPHVHSEDSVQKIMWTVVATLVPATMVGIYYFGWSALLVVGLSIGFCTVFEAAFQKWRGVPVTLWDGSAMVTALLLAMNLPAGLPWWMVAIGALLAIGLGKHAFGGLGHNIFNPALVARVFLLVSFPVSMTTWPTPTPLLGGHVDATTSATLLGLVKEKGAAAVDASLGNMMLGNMGGSIGEVGALALLLGGAWLFKKKYITWQIPGMFIGTVVVLGGLFWVINPEQYPNPLFHLFSGGLLLGALFMATDMVTSPMSSKGQIIFGFGCGLLTIVIRLFGGYPEGVSFAILIMNATTPLIDRWTVPKKFGYVAPKKKEAAA